MAAQDADALLRALSASVGTDTAELCAGLAAVHSRGAALPGPLAVMQDEPRLGELLLLCCESRTAREDQACMGWVVRVLVLLCDPRAEALEEAHLVIRDWCTALLDAALGTNMQGPPEPAGAGRTATTATPNATMDTTANSTRTAATMSHPEGRQNSGSAEKGAPDGIEALLDRTADSPGTQLPATDIVRLAAAASTRQDMELARRAVRLATGCPAMHCDGAPKLDEALVRAVLQGDEAASLPVSQLVYAWRRYPTLLDEEVGAMLKPCVSPLGQGLPPPSRAQLRHILATHRLGAAAVSSLSARRGLYLRLYATYLASRRDHRVGRTLAEVGALTGASAHLCPELDTALCTFGGGASATPLDPGLLASLHADGDLGLVPESGPAPGVAHLTLLCATSHQQRAVWALVGRYCLPKLSRTAVEEGEIAPLLSLVLLRPLTEVTRDLRASRRIFAARTVVLAFADCLPALCSPMVAMQAMSAYVRHLRPPLDATLRTCLLAAVTLPREHRLAARDWLHDLAALWEPDTATLASLCAEIDRSLYPQTVARAVVP